MHQTYFSYFMITTVETYKRLQDIEKNNLQLYAQGLAQTKCIIGLFYKAIIILYSHEG